MGIDKETATANGLTNEKEIVIVLVNIFCLVVAGLIKVVEIKIILRHIIVSLSNKNPQKRNL